MNLLSLRKCLFLLLVIVFVSSQSKVSAVELIDKEHLTRDINSAFEYSNYSNSKDYKSNIKKKRYKQNRNPLELRDNTFNSSDNVTLKMLMLKVSLILLLLFIVFAFVKIYARRRGIVQGSGFLEGVVQKLGGNLASFTQLEGVTLKQSLVLAPGQNIYLVEVDGKRLLLGATQYGGVHFLADLTPSLLSGKQIEELQSQKKNNVLNHFTNNQIQKENMSPVSNLQSELPFFETKIDEQKIDNKETNGYSGKNSFKKKVNFRESLLQNSASSTFASVK